MKKKSLLILLGLAVLLGAAGVLFEMSQSAAWSSAKTDSRILPNLPLNEISRIKLETSKTSVTLEKKNQIWSVVDRNDYPADFQKIRNLTQKLWELKAVQEMQVGASQFSRLNIVSPGQGDNSGLKIELTGEQNKALGTLIIGKSMDEKEGTGPGGRFIYNPEHKDRVFLVSERFTSLDPLMVGLWLDPSFIQADRLKEIEQKPLANNPGWKVARENDKAPWVLDGATKEEKLDPVFEGSLDSFTGGFQDVAPNSTAPDQTGLNEPFQVLLKTFDGFDYTLLLGKEGPEKARYIQVKVSADLPNTRPPEANETPDAKRKADEEFDRKTAALKERLDKEKRFEQWTYLVPGSTVESILKRRDEIIAKPAPEPKPAS